ncbi:UNVERIFIED_CONTAM: Increased DNA methylation 1 [Sesamum radiatum]|uniref:Increased DNA methylation 1 n=1 Tax=Sesamum radiatum TaxID=300843 RepID=A0AAW2K2Q8_SESRA
MQVYAGLQSRIGLKNLLSDGFSWTLLRCIPGDQKVHSAPRVVALKAECNSKLAVCDHDNGGMLSSNG